MALSENAATLLFGFALYLLTVGNMPTRSNQPAPNLRSSLTAASACESATISLGQFLDRLPMQHELRRNLGLELSWATFAPTPPVVADYLNVVAYEGDRREVMWSNAPSAPFTVTWVEPGNNKVSMALRSDKSVQLGLLDYEVQRYKDHYGHPPQAIAVETEYRDIDLSGIVHPVQRYVLARFRVRS